jgi:hypothetical protein
MKADTGTLNGTKGRRCLARTIGGYHWMSARYNSDVPLVARSLISQGDLGAVRSSTSEERSLSFCTDD